MGRKIFISYKYGDSDVYPLSPPVNALSSAMGLANYGMRTPILGGSFLTSANSAYNSDLQRRQSLLEQAVRGNMTTVRSYVDKLEEYLNIDNIYKGESDNEDLSHLSEDMIWNKLKDRIYDSSVTIVVISKNMKENNRRDRSQWIPWEISFSLKETTRNDRTSRSNAMLAVVLPDRNNSYHYFFEMYPTHTRYRNDLLFSILGKNMFNKKNINYINEITHDNDHSYIFPVKWSDFIISPQTYIENAVKRKENIYLYDIFKEV